MENSKTVTFSLGGMIFEYDEKREKELIRKAEYAEGKKEGLKEGQKQGEERVLEFIDYIEINIQKTRLQNR